MDYKTIKDLKNGDWFSLASCPKLVYQLREKYAYTTPNKNPRLAFDRYCVAVSRKNGRIRSFIHSTKVIKRDYE